MIESKDVFDVEIITSLEAQCKVDKDDLDRGWVEQPELYWHVTNLHALWSARRDEVKDRLKKTEAAVDMEIREMAAANKEKVTESGIAALVATNAKVMSLKESLVRHNYTVARLAGLKEAFDQRKEALKGLSQLYVSRYYTTDSATERDETRSRIEEATRQRRRERLRKGD